MIPVSFNALPNCLGIASEEPTTNGIIFFLTFQIFCNSLLRSWYFSIFSFSFSTILLFPEELQSQCFYMFPSSYRLIWSLSFYNMISLTTEIPQDFLIFILQNTFWLMFILLISSFKITLSNQSSILSKLCLLLYSFCMYKFATTSSGRNRKNELVGFFYYLRKRSRSSCYNQLGDWGHCEPSRWSRAEPGWVWGKAPENFWDFHCILS